MQNFRFHSAGSLEEALDYLAESRGLCKVIAGGTDLIPMLREESVRPDHVLDLMEVTEIRGVSETEDSLVIGSTTTFARIVDSEAVRRHLPLLVEAAASVGGPQIRNRGTIGGNLMTCSPAADVLPVIVCLNGVLELSSARNGARLLPVTEVITGPYQTLLKPDEMLTRIIIKKPPAAARTAFFKLGRRKALARARLNLSLVLALDKDETVSEFRVVPGAVMPVARRVKAAEERLIGRKPDQGLIDQAARDLTRGVFEVTGRRWSTEYKEPVLKNVFKRMVRQLVDAIVK
ncbi:MAG: xanthine dehydrogenase family protein subunit M [Thermodesulfobacteriota bacterium]